MHAAARWRGAGGEIDPVVGCRIRIAARERPRQHLHEVVRAAGDVAADDVRIVRLVLDAVPRVPRQDSVAESGRESLVLRFDDAGHVVRRSIRNVAVRPTGVLAGRRARVIEKALLRDEDERLSTVASFPDVRFVRSDLLDPSPNVYRRRFRALFGTPRNRSIERPVDFEHAGTVAKPAQPLDVRRRQRVAGDLRELARRDIEEHRARLRNVVHRTHRRRGPDRAAEGAKVSGQSVDDGRRSPFRARPADGVARDGEHESERCGTGGVERQERVRGAPTKQRARGVAPESLRDRQRGANSGQSESREKKWMPRQEADRPEDFVEELARIRGEWRHQAMVRVAINAQPRGGFVERQFENGGGAVVERMRDRERRLAPFESMLRQRQRLKKWRDEPHRMNRRAHIVAKPRQRQLLGARPAADGLLRLEHDDAPPRARKRDRGSKSVGPRADDDGIEFSHGCSLSRRSTLRAMDLQSFLRPLYQDLDGVSRFDDVERVAAIARRLYTPVDDRSFELLLLFHGLGRWLEKVGNLSRAVLTTGVSESELRATAASIRRLDDPSTDAERAVAAALLIDSAGVRGFAERLSRARREGSSVQDVVRNASAEAVVPDWVPSNAREWLARRYDARREVCRRILDEFALDDFHAEARGRGERRDSP